jgi:hypothetical protein
MCYGARLRTRGLELHNEDRMRTLMMVTIATALGTASAAADDLPSRKAGLWEMKTSIGNNPKPLAVKQCVDASTDMIMQAIAGPFSAQVCPKRSVQRVDNTITIDATCTISGKTATARAVIIGSLDSAYTMTVTAQGVDLPSGNVAVTMDAKWLGPCAQGQKPGDLVISNGVNINTNSLSINGVSINLRDLQKRAIPPSQTPQQ